MKKKEFVDDILRHIGTSAIPDLVLRLITCVEGTDIKQTLLDVSLNFDFIDDFSYVTIIKLKLALPMAYGCFIFLSG